MSTDMNDRTPPNDPNPPNRGVFEAVPEIARPVVLGVFAKHWTPGLTKTRLASSIGEGRAAEASRVFLVTTLARLSLVPASHVLAYTPKQEAKAFEQMCKQLSVAWRLEPQPTGNLGKRMHWFFEQSFAQGATAALLLGSDSPDFPVHVVNQGIEWLTSKPNQKLVLGPSTDGGYWLIGAREVIPPILEDMPWSQPNLMAATLAKLEALGWQADTNYRLLDTWNDIDTVEDLETLRDRLPESAEFAELSQFVGGH